MVFKTVGAQQAGIDVKIFISWSGDQSKDVALATKAWLRRVIQQLDPFVSSVDIAKGERWSATVSAALESTSEGIICVTRENQHQPWLNFEAGALAKTTASASVRPILLDLSSTDVKGPLSDFQHTDLNSRDDVLELVQSINEKCESPLADDVLVPTFDREWEAFSKEIKKIRASHSTKNPKVVTRGTEDLLAEILERVRGMERETEQYPALTHQLMRTVDMQRELVVQQRDMYERQERDMYERQEAETRKRYRAEDDTQTSSAAARDRARRNAEARERARIESTVLERDSSAARLRTASEFSDPGEGSPKRADVGHPRYGIGTIIHGPSVTERGESYYTVDFQGEGPQSVPSSELHILD